MLSNIALVTLHVLVNSDSVQRSAQELHSRVETHETAVDVVAVISDIPDKLTQSVEDGSYLTGDLHQYYTFTAETPDGDSTFTTVSN